MSTADIDVDSAIAWSNRLKQEIAEIKPLMSRVDALWEAGPVSGTIEDAYAEKLRDVDERWIKVLDTTWQGIDSVVQVIKFIGSTILDLGERVKKI